MSNPQFISVILPNENLKVGKLEVPFLGHAALILVNQKGWATFYEYGLGYTGAGVTANTKDSSEGALRSLELGKIQVDASGEINENSLKNALDTVFKTSGYYPSDPGMVFVSPVKISPGQFNEMNNEVQDFKARISTGTEKNYGFLYNNCLSFVYNTANAGGLEISPFENIPGLPAIPNAAPTNILLKNPTGYEYFSSGSSLRSSLQKTGFFDTPYAPFDLSPPIDVDIQFGKAVADDFSAVANMALSGMTPVERLRYYKAQALQNAASKPMPDHMQLYNMLQNMRTQPRSYAPIPQRQGGPSASASRNTPTSWSNPQLPQSSLARTMDRMLQSHNLGITQAEFERIGNLPNGLGASAATLPLGFYGQAGNAPVMNATKADTAMNHAPQAATANSAPGPAMRSSVSQSGIPSVAPRISRMARYAEPLNHVMEAGIASMPQGVTRVQTSKTLAPAQQSKAHAANEAQVADFSVSSAMQERQLERAMQDYFFQQSRRPPAGGAAFDPRLTPAWAGIKLPG
jgi:hypothetical protein